MHEPVAEIRQGTLVMELEGCGVLLVLDDGVELLVKVHGLLVRHYPQCPIVEQSRQTRSPWQKEVRGIP